MKKLKNIKKILNRIILSVFVLVLMVTLPNVSLKNDDNFERIYNAFLGNKTNYQGVIEVWNIDTFEGGTESKTSILNKVAKIFQKQNKGIYIMVRTVSEQECLNLLRSGERPDLFSCSFGVADKIEEYVKPFSNVDTSIVEESARKAGMKNDVEYGIAWCKGSYFLISTKEKLEKAKVSDVDKVKLSDIVLSSGYSFENKKGKTTIYSVSVGNSKYLIPQEVLRAYNKAEVNLISNESFNKEVMNQTGYSAYCEFIAGKSTILLGTQRDVYRMENRVKLGKVSDVKYEQVTGFSDLIQFMFLSKNISAEKANIAESFVNCLISVKSQSVISDGGMISITSSFNAGNDGAMQNIIPQNFNDYSTKNVFISENEIKKLQQFN